MEEEVAEEHKTAKSKVNDKMNTERHYTGVFNILGEMITGDLISVCFSNITSA